MIGLVTSRLVEEITWHIAIHAIGFPSERNYVSNSRSRSLLERPARLEFMHDSYRHALSRQVEVSNTASRNGKQPMRDEW